MHYSHVRTHHTPSPFEHSCVYAHKTRPSSFSRVLEHPSSYSLNRFTHLFVCWQESRDALIQPDGQPSSSRRVLIQWSHFLSSVALLATSLYAGCFTFTNEQEHHCHPKCHLLFSGLIVPGFTAVFNLKDGPSDDVLMVPLFTPPQIV
jgi:hypothetical protein